MSKDRGVPLFNIDVQRLTMELQLSEKTGYVEYEYSSGIMSKKHIYKTNAKAEKLFTVTFGYNPGGDLTSNKLE